MLLPADLKTSALSRRETVCCLPGSMTNNSECAGISPLVAGSVTPAVAKMMLPVFQTSHARQARIQQPDEVLGFLDLFDQIPVIVHHVHPAQRAKLHVFVLHIRSDRSREHHAAPVRRPIRIPRGRIADRSGACFASVDIAYKLQT